MNQGIDEIKLTQYSHGAGCGCKISPAVLEEILHTNSPIPVNIKLIIGNSTRDDAAVYDLGNGKGLISTTDFFMPIVDDPFDFGRIAAANAISDIYAMGGNPIMALAILGWPVEKLPAALAKLVIEGGREVCQAAGIPLAGGHSIDTIEPMFGLSVNGLIDLVNLKPNSAAREGDQLFLTKPLGVGIFSTAMKRGLLKSEDKKVLMEQLTSLNKVGYALGNIKSVHAMTDVTGFGLLGHLIELAEGSELSAEIEYSQIPKLKGVEEYLKERIVPDATYRNWNSYSQKVAFAKGVNVMEAFNLLPDPQTNGGLLVSVGEDGIRDVEKIFSDHQLIVSRIGKMKKIGEKRVEVIV